MLTVVVVLGIAAVAFVNFRGGDEQQPSPAAGDDAESVARATVEEIGKLDEGTIDNVDGLVCDQDRSAFRDRFRLIPDTFADLRAAASRAGTSLAEINPTFQLGEVHTDGDTGVFEIRYKATFDGQTNEDVLTGHLVREGTDWRVCDLR